MEDRNLTSCNWVYHTEDQARLGALLVVERCRHGYQWNPNKSADGTGVAAGAATSSNQVFGWAAAATPWWCKAEGIPPPRDDIRCRCMTF